MKIPVDRLFASILILTAFLLATSCKKSSNGSNASFTATVNGTAWAANIPETGELISAGFELGGIQYKGGDSTAIALGFSAYSKFSQPLNSSDSADMVDISYVDLKTRTAYDGGIVAGHSTITITSYDSLAGKIAGTFSGVLYNISGGSDSMSITNGIFNTTFVSY
ncbi:MAG TPA: hypothetical protein VFE32_18890 [Puia sp.]|jgi:hypothetical protein|nr:hypothetical protein [Puia sp.]